MLQADIAKFLASVGFKADEKSLNSALAKVAAFGASAQLIAAGVTAGIMAVARSQVQVARDADNLRTGTKRLEELRYVAEQTGAETANLDAALKGLGDKYPRIKDTSELFERMGNRMRRMTEEQQKAYARRMGIDPSLIPMLTKDVSGLSDEFRQMYALAGSDAKEATEASKGFLAEIGKIRTMAGYMAKAVAMAFIGRVRGDLETLRRAFMENFGNIRKVLEFIVGLVLRVSGVISAFIYRAIQFVSSLIAWFDKLDGGTRKLIIGAGLLLAAWKVLNLGFLATPLGMLIAGLTAVVALVDDYLTYMEGGESYFDWSPWAESINKAVEALRPILGVVAGIGKGIAAAVGPAIAFVVEQLAWMGRFFTQTMQLVYRLFTGDFAGAADVFKGMLADMAATGERIINAFCETVAAFFGALWPSVEENFPDFAAWARSSAEAITGLVGRALAWVKEKLAALVEWMPDWVKDRLGMSGLSAGPDFSAPALAPSHATAAALSQNAGSSVEMNAKTEIHMHTADPIAAGNQVAAKQNEVNAEVVRNMKGSAR